MLTTLEPLVVTRRMMAMSLPLPAGCGRATVITYQVPSGRPLKEKRPALSQLVRRTNDD